MKQMNIQYKVIYKVNETQWEEATFHTLERAKHFAELKGGVIVNSRG